MYHGRGKLEGKPETRVDESQAKRWRYSFLSILQLFTRKTKTRLKGHLSLDIAVYGKITKSSDQVFISFQFSIARFHQTVSISPMALISSSSKAPPTALHTLLHSPLFSVPSSSSSLFNFSLSLKKTFLSLSRSVIASGARTRTRFISRDVALKSNSSTAIGDDLSPSPSSFSSSSFEEVEADEEELKKALKIGARVRVKVPLKVYHVPRLSEVELTGMEGVIKQYVGLWKGKRISANLPYKVEFQLDNVQGQGRGPGVVKFFAHLKEDDPDSERNLTFWPIPFVSCRVISLVSLVKALAKCAVRME
ncbi:hypothetical protein Ancab_016144, partial [Ancistrocladus abbreviatus]